VTEAPGQPTQMPSLAYITRPGLERLVLRNLALNMVTLWIYRFWAKTRWRRHIWTSVSLLGDPIEYTGTGAEMFKGFLIALAVLAPLFILFNLWQWAVSESAIGLLFEQIIYFATLYFLIVAARFYARRYRLSRTWWRGVPLALDARFIDYLKVHFTQYGLALLTLFLLWPRASLMVEAWLMSKTRLGNVHFDCKIEWRPAFWPWITFLCGALLAVAIILGKLAATMPQIFSDFGLPGLSLWWAFFAVLFAAASYTAYRVKLLRQTINGLRLGDVVFSSQTRAAPVITFIVVGVATLLAIGTLGALMAIGTGSFLVILAIPIAFLVAHAIIRDAWVAPWIVDHIVNSVTIMNPLSLNAIANAAQDSMTRGEGLADSFDVGIV
jgi:uncharacterized membrane protein YjgN (DUF898 family)